MKKGLKLLITPEGHWRSILAVESLQSSSDGAAPQFKASSEKGH
jgi:hypothetical protein